MFTKNPFAALTDVLPANVMQIYVVLMVVAVFAGTLFDIIHKGSARYFFENWRRSKNKGSQAVGGGDMVSLAIKTGLVDVLTSGEFCNARRRVAHLLTMYGFVIYVVTTACMVFGYATPATPTPAHPAAPLVDRRIDDLRRRILVLVLHPGRCRRRGPFAAAPHARGSVHPLASLQRDAGPDLGLPASEGELRGQRVLRLVHHRHDGAVRIGAVVQVRAHVLQARGGVREKGFLRERLQEQPARPLRQARAVRQCSQSSPGTTDRPTIDFHFGRPGPPCQPSFT